MKTSPIGFIGQGWIGKNYADDFERRGYDVVRYALEEPYVANRDQITSCEVVFIAVPTPTTREGFDANSIRKVLPLVGAGKIAVIKSSMIPGTTEALQTEFPDRIILHAPEFLREKMAAYDAAHPERALIGIPIESALYREAAERVLALLPPAPYVRVMSARAAELVKYAGNAFLATKVIFANLLYDVSEQLVIEYQEVEDALGADPRIGPSHLKPVLESGHTEIPGRGAGGHCFIKDLEAYRQLYAQVVHDTVGSAVLDALVHKNNALLRTSGKDLDLLREVYGEDNESLA